MTVKKCIDYMQVNIFLIQFVKREEGRLNKENMQTSRVEVVFERRGRECKAKPLFTCSRQPFVGFAPNKEDRKRTIGSTEKHGEFAQAQQ